ncbi:hypothetical protein AOL_s00081g123 [Orbilia oligospora ATCC 24927]|uniref:Uncharacterized protein n=1 Tax=Arthrobotrys oligospora (strain ATCC 24927 / CBS 115.81 / DSM 1491) TaxID=756982 RepID=G1XFI1_ARTOA|nr:hypothetical protein AOL_s00081g123 [Orbilia oligospora ATCC 24927]EGX48127.1 hypothetical protein AOL_s00081g123 [Orbilia oligospora ATCC 24927]
MDPLSVTASIIAIVTAAVQVSNGLAKLIALRGAPEIVMALQNEVSDLRLVVHSCESILNKHVTLGGQQGNVWGLPPELIGVKNLLDRATNELKDICQVVETKLVDSKGKFSKIGYMKEQSKLIKAKDGLRDIRMEIANGIGLMNSASSFRIEARVEQLEISLQQSLQYLALENRNGISQIISSQNSLHKRVDGFQQNTGNQLQLIPTQTVPAIGGIPHASATIPPTSSPQITYSYNKSITNYQRDSVILPLSISSGGLCDPLCKCVCHRRRNIQSPSILSKLVGDLFIGYNGIPSISPSCTIRNCSRDRSGNMRVQYAFPKWLLTKMLSVHVRVSQCPEVLIKTWNVRCYNDLKSWENPFYMVGRADLEGLSRLFQEGKASSKDIDSNAGHSLIHWAINGILGAEDRLDAYLRMIEFLLSQGVDSTVENYYGNSPYSYACLIKKEYQLASVDSALNRILNDPNIYLPESEIDFDALEMTKLHKIIIGIETGDLREELKGYLGLSLIDKSDKMGRTPLMWAVIRNDLETIEILLKNGADVTKCCKEGKSILIRSRSVESLALCLKYCPPQFINSFSTATPVTPLLYYCNFEISYPDGISESQENENLRLAALLIDAGADVNLGTASGISPLTYMAGLNYPRTTKFLLDHGADVNRCNGINVSTVIMDTIRGNKVASLSVILREARNINFGLKDKYGWNFLHYLARYGSFEVLELFRTVDFSAIDVEVSLEIVDCKEGLYGGTPIEVMDWRFENKQNMDRIPESNEEEWQTGFMQLLDRIRGSARVSLVDDISSSASEEEEDSDWASDLEDSSDEEEFYDCHSRNQTWSQDAAETST